jgi:hypothetical protein
MQALIPKTSKLLPLVLLFTSCIGASFHLVRAQSSHPDFTAHEWGTLTSVAGNDGQAVEWTPYDGSTDLPGFVEHLGDQNLKGGLRGKIRMETPVIYFYTSRAMRVAVKVRFSQGLLTEWYPRASQVEPAPIPDRRFYDTHIDGSIAWDSVALEPNSTAVFPREHQENQYYAARETSAAPLAVNTSRGEQREKFLFYRGVSGTQVPLGARVTRDGNVLVRNLGSDEIPSVILFERRGDMAGYRVSGALLGEINLQRPELNSTRDALDSELESVLVQQGLFNDEAHAMIETWRKSWFEEGSRVFYIAPRQFVDTILPLSIRPAPAEIVRVYVGRLEIVTPATEREVASAMAAHDPLKLAKYQRFLEPITNVVLRNRYPGDATSASMSINTGSLKRHRVSISRSISKCSFQSR